MTDLAFSLSVTSPGPHRSSSLFLKCKQSLSTPKHFTSFSRTPRKLLQPKPQWKLCASSTPQVEQDLTVLTYQTEPIEGQAMGTSGMRKKTRVVLTNPSFVPNWVQSLFNALGTSSTLSGATLVLGGDGRYYNKVAIQTIIRVAAGNGFARVVVGRDGLLTTPAVSALIPVQNALGGIILTASHNPGGIDGDWGVKFNTSSGAPAQAALTMKIYEHTQMIREYRLADLGADIDLSITGETSFSGGKFTVEVINPVTQYINMLSQIFDFDAIRSLISRPDFSFIFDAMHASTGEYARYLFEEVLHASTETVVNGISLDDFGGSPPDPNLTYAADLVARIDPKQNPDAPQFGAASDGDGDRNMILGRGVFVSPADSLAIITDYAEQAIPYFARYGVRGVARSMPTSSAVDRVALAHNVPLYQTPTGWKFFTNLMDGGLVNICGEESFGTGSDHIREKDGIWAVLAWLSILALENRKTPIGKLVSVKDILLAHWRKYGRTYNLRYDYKEVDEHYSEIFMMNLYGMAAQIVPTLDEVQSIEEFEYKDPVDKSITSNQGVIACTVDGRVAFRLSGTDSSGATVRIYFEKYEAPSDSLDYKEAKEELKDLIDFALKLARVEEITGRTEPDVVT